MRPHAPPAAVLAMLITPFTVSCAIGIFKSPRPNLRVYLEFSICSLAFFFFHFMWYYLSIHSQISSVILQTFNDIRWRKVIGKKKSLFLPRSGTVQGTRERGSTSFLKSPKHTSRNRSVFSTNRSIRI